MSRPRDGVCVFTSVCEEDGYWIPQYLTETERLGLCFAMHLDHCHEDTKQLVKRHPNCIGTTEENSPYRPFDETHKQAVHDLVRHAGFKWSMAWDIDETYETDAGAKIDELLTNLEPDVTTLVTSFLTLWGDWKHIRTDPPLGSGWRSKFNRLDVQLRFLHRNVNGPTRVNDRGEKLPYREVKTDLVCLHWGMISHELRVLHKQRWERVYGSHHSYGIWKASLDETGLVVAEHHYLDHLEPHYECPRLFQG